MSRCPTCEAEVHTGPEAPVRLERLLLVLGIFGVLQGVRIFMSLGDPPQIQAARALLGVLGTIFLLVYFRVDLSNLRLAGKIGLRAAIVLAVMLHLSMWLS